MKRYPSNPIIKRSDVKSANQSLNDVSSVFNPGAVYFEGQYLLLLRVQNRGRETFTIRAVSEDGYSFLIDENHVEFVGLEEIADKIHHLYDPRITKVDNKYIVTFSIDFDQSSRVGLFETVDFNQFRFISLVSDDDCRNGVIFPEKINNKYIMYIRPNQESIDGLVKSGSEIIAAESEDLKNWKMESSVLKGRWHYWDELIGAGPPPVKTREGWLLIYHGVATHFQSSNIYQAGAALFDLVDPTKCIGRSKFNFLEPREMYEMIGQVPNVVFPSGLIVDKYDKDGFVESDSGFKLYYGAADSSIGLFEGSVSELIKLCVENE